MLENWKCLSGKENFKCQKDHGNSGQNNKQEPLALHKTNYLLHTPFHRLKNWLTDNSHYQA
jgi:hypothetical protein